MKLDLQRLISMPGAMSLACLAGLLLAFGPLPRISAQAPSGFWSTSAEAPDTMAPALFSAPEASMSPGRDDPPGTASLVLGLTSWRVTGSALKPRENDVSYGVNSTGGCTYVTSGDSFTVWNIDPGLPNGTVVNTLRMYYNDTSASNSTAWFTVYDLYGTIVQEWSVSSSGNSGNSFNDSATINHRTDLSVYNYLLNWRPTVTGSTMQLCGFRVFHETALPAPGVPQALAYTVSGSTVMLTWSPPVLDPTPTSYVLEAGSVPGASNLAVVPVAGTQFVTAGVPRGTYYVRVKAVNSVGSGPATADVAVVVP